MRQGRAARKADYFGCVEWSAISTKADKEESAMDAFAWEEKAREKLEVGFDGRLRFVGL